MKKLSLFASVSAALVCAAVPASFDWSPANVTLFSLDRAEARVGRPLTATSVAGVSRRVHRREYRREATGAAVGAAAVGGVAVGAYAGDLPQPTGPDLRSPSQPLMASRAMAWPRARAELCDREPCHGKVVPDRMERLSMVLDAIAAIRDEVTGKT